MSKISFKNESRHIPGFPLNKIETIGNFQEINNDKQDRLDIIDRYAEQLNDIIANRKSSGLIGTASRKIKETEIAYLYLKITGKNSKGNLKKNDMIDFIENFYRTQYVSRNVRNQSNTSINISENIFGVTTNQNTTLYNESDSDDSDIDI